LPTDVAAKNDKGSGMVSSLPQPSAEITEVLYGVENTMIRLERVMSNVQLEAVICADSKAPAFSMGVEQIRKGYEDFKRRGVKARFVTEVTADNLHYCKQLAQFAEVRHLPKIKGNMAVSETEYVATAVLEGDKPVSQTIYSNAKSMVEQQRYFFENLWIKAVPIEHRISEIDKGIAPEVSEVIYGFDKATERILVTVRNAQERIDGCGDHRAPARILGYEPYLQALMDAKRRSVKMRLITNITKENINLCKRLLEVVDQIKHVDDIKISTGVTEKEYVATTITGFSSTNPITQVIYSNSQPVVEQERFTFDTLWAKAIPAKQRFMEIEQGLSRIETTTIDDPQEITKQIKKTVEEARNGYSICSNFNAMQLVFSMPEYYELYTRVLDEYKHGQRGTLRWMGNITKNDIEAVTKFIDLGMEIRHSQELALLNFGVSDKRLIATLEAMEGNRMVQNLMVSNDPVYVHHFNLLFDEVWKKSIDAKQRIDEIQGRGGEEAKTYVIQRPDESLSKSAVIIQAAKQEIFILLSTKNAVFRSLKLGGMELYKQAIQRGTRLRMLLPDDPEIHALVDGIRKQIPQIEFGFMEKNMQTGISVLLVDKQELMIWEMKDDTKDDPMEAVGTATYSNSKSVIPAFYYIYDSLWQKAELGEKLKIHDKMQQEFINIAAHEIRTPVQPLLGMAELLEYQLSGEKDKVEVSKDDISIIIRNARRLERLTSDILEVTRIESGSMKLNREIFDLNEKVRQIVRDLAQEMNRHTIKIIAEVSNTPLHVNADKSKIYEVLSNMIRNAIKFTDDGRIIVKTESIEYQGNYFVRVTVRDTGTGISKEIMPRLFTKFATTSDGGTGIGLFISKNIIEEHGGSISGENNADGRGATFYFTLPLTKTFRSYR
jgi:two-component system sensor histidine kinase VicK